MLLLRIEPGLMPNSLDNSFLFINLSISIIQIYVYYPELNIHFYVFIYNNLTPPVYLGCNSNHSRIINISE